MTSNNEHNNTATNHTPAKKEKSTPVRVLKSVTALIVITLGVIFFVSGINSGLEAITRSLPALSALAGTYVITYQWRQNYDQNNQRMTDENERHQKQMAEQGRLHREQMEKQSQLHREQARNNRQENLGDRLAAATNHLSGTTAVEQVAVLTELAGIAEDWWNLGQEMKNDLPDTEEQQQITGMVDRRRQEIIDLIFKTPLATLEQDSDEERQRDKQVQQRRSYILRNNIPDATHTQDTGNPPKPQQAPQSWARLNFENADLRQCDLHGKDLRKIKLQNAKLSGANLSSAGLQGAKLEFANLQGAKLQKASC